MLVPARVARAKEKKCHVSIIRMGNPIYNLNTQAYALFL